MAINFPSSPVEGQIHNASVGKSFVYKSGVWAPAPMTTALPKNYLVNPGFFVSQQNGATASPASAAITYYAADQWVSQVSVAGGSFYVARWEGTCPYSGSKSVYLHVTTPVASLAAGDYAMLTQHIEGIRAADLQWGTPQAKDVVLTFTQSYNFGAGTFSARVTNSDGSRSFVAPYTVGTSWQRPIIAIPGDTTGTWLKTAGTIGIRVDIVYAVGSTRVGVAGWQNGNMFAVAGQTNPLSAVTDLHVTTAGFYADPYKTGMSPEWELPDITAEIKRCQRYWCRMYGLVGGAAAATAASRMGGRLPVPMMIKPAATIVGAPRIYDGAITAPISATITANTSNHMFAELDLVGTAATWGSGRALSQYFTADADYIAMNARLL